MCLVPTEAKPFLKNMIPLFLNRAIFDSLVMRPVWFFFIEGISAILSYYVSTILRFISRYDKLSKKGELVMVDFYSLSLKML